MSIIIFYSVLQKFARLLQHYSMEISVVWVFCIVDHFAVRQFLNFLLNEVSLEVGIQSNLLLLFFFDS